MGASARVCGGCASAAVVLLMMGGCGGSHAKSAGSSAATTARTHTSSAPPAASTVSASASGTSRTVSASSGATTVTLRAGSHEPKSGVIWPLNFTARTGSAAAHASVSYEYLFGSQVVARRSHYTFVGRFADSSIWPRDSVGYPLTFRAIVKVRASTFNLDYPVRVRP